MCLDSVRGQCHYDDWQEGWKLFSNDNFPRLIYQRYIKPLLLDADLEADVILLSTENGPYQLYNSGWHYYPDITDAYELATQFGFGVCRIEVKGNITIGIQEGRTVNVAQTMRISTKDWNEELQST